MAYTTLIKPCGGACNYRCKHCFYKPISEINDCVMPLEDVDIVINRLSEIKQSEYINILFQGGEPLLAGIYYYKYFTDRVKEKMPNHRVNYSIQTNGSLLNKEWVNLLKKNHFLVGISLDGDKSLNDRYRIKHDGSSSYSDITAATKLMDANHLEYNILTVITREVAANPIRVLSHYKRLGYKYLQFTMPIGYENNNDFMPTNEEMYLFLSITFSDYSKKLFNKDSISIRYYDNLLTKLTFGGAEQCGLCGKCSPYIVIDPKLNCYPCDFYSYSQYNIGNLRQNSIDYLLSSDKFIEFASNTQSTPDDCIDCKYLDVCGGGCKRYRSFDGAILNAKNYYCDAYRRFFDNHMADLKRLSNILKSKSN